MNYQSVVVAAVAAFVASGLWYSPLLFGTLYAQVRGAEPATVGAVEIGVELLRTLVVAFSIRAACGAARASGHSRRRLARETPHPGPGSLLLATRARRA
jgi:hypothetical protein